MLLIGAYEPLLLQSRYYASLPLSSAPKLTEVVKIKSMASSLNTTDPAGPKPPSFGIGHFLFVVFLAVLFFLLGHSMVRHRFFEGGRVHRNGSIGQ
jgi:hypothetical protein